MFKLLKSELNYSITPTIIVWGIIILTNVILTVEGQWAHILIMQNYSKMLWGFFVLYYVIFVQSRIRVSGINKSGRRYMHVLLPLTNYQIRSVKIFSLLFLWVVPIIILTFFYLLNVRQPFNAEWLKIVGFMTIGYLLFLLMILISDDIKNLTFLELKKYLNLFSQIITYLIVFLLNYVFIAKINFSHSITNQIIHKYILSERGIELNLIIGIVLIITSIFTFNKRKSFL